MRNEDGSRRKTQHQGSYARRSITHPAILLVPISLFISAYLATFAALALVAPEWGRHWIALASAALATGVAIVVFENHGWSVGLVTSPAVATREFAAGIAFAAFVMILADQLIVRTTSVHHTLGPGFSWRELLVVFLPAAIHEELVFRGYLFQRIRSWNRWFGIALSASVFAALHGGNRGVNFMALLSLLVAGVMLCLSYERFHRLWFPIGIHLGWNVVSGPLLGYAVSGYPQTASVLTTAGAGPFWLSGGDFGIEASLWTLLLELCGASFLFLRGRRGNL